SIKLALFYLLIEQSDTKGFRIYPNKSKIYFRGLLDEPVACLTYLFLKNPRRKPIFSQIFYRAKLKIKSMLINGHSDLKTVILVFIFVAYFFIYKNLRIVLFVLNLCLKSD